MTKTRLMATQLPHLCYVVMQLECINSLFIIWDSLVISVMNLSVHLLALAMHSIKKVFYGF